MNDLVVKVPEILQVNNVEVVVDVSDLLVVSNDLLTAAQEAAIVEKSDYEFVSEILTQSRSVRKQIEDRFSPYLEAAKNAKKTIEGIRAAIVTATEDACKIAAEAEKILADKMKQFTLEQMRKKEEAEKAIRAGNATAEAVVMALSEAPKTSGVSMRKVWKYKASDEPLDPEYTTKDHLGFIVPDHKKIAAMVTAMKDRTNIRGVAVYYDLVPAVRA